MNISTFQQITEGAEGVMVVMSASDLKAAMASMFAKHEAKTAAAIEAHREQPTLTRHQASKVLNVTLSTLWRWARDGYLTPVKIGSKVLYRASDIDKLLLTRKRIETPLNNERI